MQAIFLAVCGAQALQLFCSASKITSSCSAKIALVMEQLVALSSLAAGTNCDPMQLEHDAQSRPIAT